jgi:SAM-dependent methyltransferase
MRRSSSASVQASDQKPIRHPAKYSDIFLPIFVELLQGLPEVLDPFAGVGKLAEIKKYGFTGSVICNEIEKDWISLGKSFGYCVDQWHCGDAAHMRWIRSGTIGAITTSVCYGNRMADHHHATDGSRRNTYTHCIGHPLRTQNTGQLQWGEKYRQKHLACYREFWRVLEPEGLFILNISNHIRKGKEIDVVGWNRQIIPTLGFEFIEERKVETHRNRQGENYQLRVATESILVFRKISRN